MKKDSIPKVKPLDNVFWYPKGDTDTQGCPAVVYSNDGYGGLKLCIHMIEDPRNLWVSGVRNINDPEVLDRPILARNQGLWESQAQYLERMELLEMEREEQRRISRQQQEEETVLRRARAQKEQDELNKKAELANA